MEWFFNTKVGHFIFLMIGSIFLELIFCNTFMSMSDLPVMVLTSLVVSVYFAYTDDNEKII